MQRGARQFGLGLDLRQRRPALRQFVFQFRHVDLGQQVALLDGIADGFVPLLQVAVGAGEDLGFGVAAQGRRQSQFTRAVANPGTSDDDVALQGFGGGLL